MKIYILYPPSAITLYSLYTEQNTERGEKSQFIFENEYQSLITCGGKWRREEKSSDNVDNILIFSHFSLVTQQMLATRTPIFRTEKREREKSFATYPASFFEITSFSFFIWPRSNREVSLRNGRKKSVQVFFLYSNLQPIKSY